jgi:Tfp pilus assembly protein PilN
VSQRDFSTERRVARSRGGLGLLAAGMLALVSVALLDRRAAGTESQQAAAVASARGEIAKLQQRIRALEAGRGADAQALGQLRLTNAASPSRVLAALTDELPAGARLTSVALSYGERLRLQLQLETRTTEAYDRFLERLAEAGVLEELEPSSERRDGAVTGGLKAVWSEAGGAP